MRLKWLVAVVLICGIPAFAGPILLNNTGMNGGVAVTPGQLDPNWILLGGGYNASVVTGSPSTEPFPYWLPNDATSQWIAPLASYVPGESDPESYWVFQTGFTIDPGMDPLTASITGRWLADNLGADIYVNGVPYIPSQQTTRDDFQEWVSFTLSGSSGSFLSGANTLQFIVLNGDGAGPDPGGPTGLRVEMTGEVDELAAIPEPATFGLLGAGLLALGLVHRRRQRA